jgi:hypothetical protein
MCIQPMMFEGVGESTVQILFRNAISELLNSEKENKKA